MGSVLCPLCEGAADIAGDGWTAAFAAAELVFQHACELGLEGIVSKRRNSPYRSGRSLDWIKSKNPAAPAVRREVEEDWGQ